MVRLISRGRGGLAALKLTKLFGIDDFPAAKDSGKVFIIIIYLIIVIAIVIIIIIIIIIQYILMKPIFCRYIYYLLFYIPKSLYTVKGQMQRNWAWFDFDLKQTIVIQIIIIQSFT